MDGIPSRPVNRSKAGLPRLIGQTQARTRRPIAQSRELIAEARLIREEFPRIRGQRKDAA